MNLYNLREAQADFTERKAFIIESRNSLYTKRDGFASYFNINKINQMCIDDFVIGKGENNFCRKLERDLDGLGRIIGSTAFKFGVYFGRTKSDSEYKYRYTQIWGNDYNDAYKKISLAIIKLIEDGKNQDIEAIVRSKISPMFKGKILSTYYPERYLNVFSDDHLKYFLKEFDLDTPKSLSADPVIKRDILLEFKNNDAVMRNWSADMFSVFLYNFYPKRPVKKTPEFENDILTDYFNPQFPNNPYGTEIKLNILPYSHSQKKIREINNSKPDYEKINGVNKKLGDRGEKVVLDFEIRKLEQFGKFELAKKVDRVSLKSDNLGYDILSFDENGQEIFIEVKATHSKIGNANFFLTINELNTAKEKENYYIYMVYEIQSKEPKIWIIQNPFNPSNENIMMQPVNFKVTIKVQ